ncbi:purine nucleoside phosphorylase-like isoform X2 [Teleopsis dalmanni]|uniref:purine nucleoside phosphorylase-like isoform X2 n=1 Tax=Teleopsis dalmanni TaxID=139649 RepID=UPI0018CF05BC|nr:purine nucleoside phosphorylase-like isoform X2 [Teleopsis dalmanni]
MASLACANNEKYNQMKEAAAYLLARTDIRPRIGIVCGSGLSNLAEEFTDAESFQYRRIPHFPISTVDGHAGRLVFGYIENIPLLAMKGCFHHFEGYSLPICTFPIRVMKLVGIEILIITNASGGVNEKYNIGDIMLLRDHINFPGLCGKSPLNGANFTDFGPRFPPMANTYDKELREIAVRVADEMKINKFFHVGIYACVGGPSCETIAEQQMMRLFEIDAVEYDLEDTINHEEILAVSENREKVCSEFVRKCIHEIEYPPESTDNVGSLIIKK